MSDENRSAVCPTCRRPFGAAPRRICAACGKGILGRHKWRFRKDGRVEHRVCRDPESYPKGKPS